MAYQYEFRQIKNSKKNLGKTILVAKFGFEDEVPPKDYEQIKRNMANKYVGSALTHYLQHVENLEPSTSSKFLSDHPTVDYFRKPSNDSTHKKLTIKNSPWKLGIDVRVSVDKSVPLEKVLNLEKMNNFILTGNYPK